MILIARSRDASKSYTLCQRFTGTLCCNDKKLILNMKDENGNVITPESAQDNVETQVTETPVTETIEQIVEKPQTVGLDKYLDTKRELKEAQAKIKELSDNKGNKSNSELSQDINELANEYNIDPDFMAKLVNGVKGEVKSEYDSKLKPILEKEEKAQFKVTFDQKYNLALENMPEYKTVVNPQVIETLFLLRDSSGKLVNGNKTIEQLIEDTYSNAIGGKRTLETTTPRGGKEPTEIDFNKASTNAEYFKEIMANPTLKAKYNKNIEDRLNL